MEQFYLQDSRGYVGNDVLWWAKDGNGYTTDLSKAETYTKDEAQRMHDSRRSDVPWPKSYIDTKTRPAVDMQYIKRDEALAGTGIVLTPEEIDLAKAWTCAAHIVSEGGDTMNEGYLLDVSDRMFWDNVHASLSQSNEGYNAEITGG